MKYWKRQFRRHRSLRFSVDNSRFVLISARRAVSQETIDIVVLPGDGIGPEISRATCDVLSRLSDLRCLGLSLNFLEVGLVTLKKFGTTLPEKVSACVRSTEAFIIGPLSTSDYPPLNEGGVNPSAYFRTKLELYANMRPARTRSGLPSMVSDMDLLIMRENTEGFYACRSMYRGSGEFMPDADTAFAIRKISRQASRRIALAAFEQARIRRKRVCVIHKRNVLKVSDGLFLETVREVASSFPEVNLEELLVDAAVSLLIRDASHFDVILTTNMFGDILSNEAAELSGGLGLGPSLNFGDDQAMAQASHGSAPDIAGQNKANPTALILSATMLLDWLGSRHQRLDLVEAARDLQRAVDRALEKEETRTSDLQGPLGTQGFASVVAANLSR